MCGVESRKKCQGCGLQDFKWDFAVNPPKVQPHRPQGGCAERTDREKTLGRECKAVRERYLHYVLARRPIAQPMWPCDKPPNCCRKHIEALRTSRDYYQEKHDRARRDGTYARQGGNAERDGRPDLQRRTSALDTARMDHFNHCGYSDSEPAADA